MDPNTRRDGLAAIAILLGIAAAGIAIPPSWRLASWLVILVLMTLFVILAGTSITGLPRGALVDGRNRMSLSRFQLLAWTLLVLSAFLTAALSNIRAGIEDPLAIAIPEQLWILMGISTTSLIGSPLLLSTKAKRLGDRIEFDRTSRDLRDDVRSHMENCDCLKHKDRPLEMLLRNKTRAASRWSELFAGEETGNAAHLDIARVQMFFFTFVLLLAYAVTLGRLFLEPGRTVTEFPSLDHGIIALLGISHTGYLAGKVLPWSKEDVASATDVTASAPKAKKTEK